MAKKPIKVDEDVHERIYELKGAGTTYGDFVRTLLEYYEWRHPALSGEPPEGVEDG